MSKSIKILSTFLLCAVTLFYTAVTAFAIDYSGMNDTVYKSADYFGLEELPYGVDTGVIQFQYGSGNFLTLYFDRLSIYDDFSVADFHYSNLNDHFWKCYYVINSDGSYDYEIDIVSDNPIYYKTSYAGGNVFSSYVGKSRITEVINTQQSIDGTSVAIGKTYSVYELDKFLLSELVPDSWVLSSSNRRIYSNVYMSSDYYSYEYNKYYIQPIPPTGQKNFVNGTSVGYNVEYYPSCEYLQNLSIREQLLEEFNVLDIISTDVTDILSELYSVNSYLDSIYSISADIKSSVAVIEQYTKVWIAPTLIDIKKLLEGPEYDSSQGLGSNTEFGDSAGGLMQDTVVPDVGTQSIATNLGNSFLFIRNMFDRVTGEFNLTYIISFLLGLSFIAYVLGRVIKNKMNS